ncbi:hypothetical protein M426DRAFT_325778 [Hypoxylon sp. CI-4A]|nr:hypothetical protein M426DRAFT_325778 [Hypoxylon sp. CI-4A]
MQPTIDNEVIKLLLGSPVPAWQCPSGWEKEKKLSLGDVHDIPDGLECCRIRRQLPRAKAF